MHAHYRFNSEKHNDGEKSENKIGASKCDVKDVHSLFSAESTSRQARVNCSETDTMTSKLQR